MKYLELDKRAKEQAIASLRDMFAQWEPALADDLTDDDIAQSAINNADEFNADGTLA